MAGLAIRRVIFISTGLTQISLGCDKRPRLSLYSFKRGRLKQPTEDLFIFFRKS
jgi:hypothetical protein